MVFKRNEPDIPKGIVESHPPQPHPSDLSFQRNFARSLREGFAGPSLFQTHRICRRFDHLRLRSGRPEELRRKRSQRYLGIGLRQLGSHGYLRPRCRCQCRGMERAWDGHELLRTERRPSGSRDVQAERCVGSEFPMEFQVLDTPGCGHQLGHERLERSGGSRYLES